MNTGILIVTGIMALVVGIFTKESSWFSAGHVLISLSLSISVHYLWEVEDESDE